MVSIVRSKTEQAISLAKYLPSGRLFRQAYNSSSNLHKFLKGLASELVLADEYLRTYVHETIPSRTTLFLEEWERTVGIPDDCFPGTGDIDTRRTHVLIKLASLGVQTSQDFEDLAALFGVTVTVGSGVDFASFPMELPMLLLSPTEARFTIIVLFTVTTPNEFPMTFPITFGDQVIAIVQCLFNKLKPANCQTIFLET
jgi:uncharacterized protein YmfQ (DUF2313 family)